MRKRIAEWMERNAEAELRASEAILIEKYNLPKP